MGVGAVIMDALAIKGQNVEIVELERAKCAQLAYHESGGRSRNGDFKKRVAAMQRRKTAEASAKNAQRAYNAMSAK